ncbi:MAG: tRNA lysidine(34) synthetase TilS [Fibromonadales bacterium]|nr:tRNA lysidine(34) synthetase TilS [Fibromonadales bacterium]
MRLWNKSVLLAISGGLDSMCMLHRFAKLNTYAAYVNHGIRQDAVKDAELIKKKCEEYGVPFYELFIDPKIFGSNFEAVAREARYNLLFELKNKLNADFLATAHHRDDQAETVFLRIARGTGLKGLRGILPERRDGVIRPMLELSKHDLLEYAKKNNIEWREDPTNTSPEHFRNRVRLQILPKMESSTVNSLARIAELSQRVYPKALKILDSYFNPFLVSPAEEVPVVLRHFYLPQGYGELFRMWLGNKGISWEATNEDAKLYEKLQKKGSFKFRLGKVYFERKKEDFSIVTVDL